MRDLPIFREKLLHFRACISERQFRRIVPLFAPDLSTVQIAILTCLNYAPSELSPSPHYGPAHGLALLAGAPISGKIDVNESYFGARHIKSKRGRGAFGKTAAFSIFKRNGRISTEVIPDCRRAALQSIICGRADF